jgi:hypothetical protein
VDGPSGSTGGKVQLNGVEYDKVTSSDAHVEVTVKAGLIF